MDILGQSSLILGVTSFALGFSILSRNVKNKLFLAFAVLTTLVSCWALAFFFEKVSGSGNFYRWHLFFNIWLAPAALTLIRVMVRIRDNTSRRLLDLSVLLSLSLSVALILRYETIPWVLLLVYFEPAAVLLQIFVLMWIDRRLRAGFKRLPKLPTVGFSRRNLIYAGGLLVLATTVMDHVPFLGKIIPSFGNIGLAVYLFFISQAITEQRLLNFGALFSRFIVLLAVALTLTGVYSLLVAWIENSPGLFFLNSFIASFLILMLLDPLRTAVRYFTHRLLSTEHRRLEQTLREAQRKLTGIVDLGSLFHAILLTTEQTLQPGWAALFVLRGDGTKFRRVRIAGKEPQTVPAPGASPILKEILADHPLLQYCESLQKKGELPILLDQIIENEIDRSASRVQREGYAALIQGLKALGSNLLIPIVDSGKIMGFVTLWAPAPPEPWGSNWGLLPIIYPYFEQVAATMRSMEIYVRQREKERLAALGEMAAGLAHEIRNPLGAIKGAAQFLDPTEDKPESRFLRVIIEEVDRLNRVVTQFLDYSKPPTTDFKVISLASLVRKTVEMMNANPRPGVKLECLPGDTTIQVQVAPEQIQQVLINLIQNATKALEKRVEEGIPGLIQVGIEREGIGQQSEAVITVEDNGHGIKREHLEKLFIPFFTTSPSGTGLGLSISQKIIESHRGRIDVVTEEGRFTRFSVILPEAKE
ncbi:MAG TPA: ATP-binding protein [Bdellovibrionota bacterium]|nr:ATP-binding protein [Bdellovibrionota bacterium]